jgi:hypothetical protein
MPASNGRRSGGLTKQWAVVSRLVTQRHVNPHTDRQTRWCAIPIRCSLTNFVQRMHRKETVKVIIPKYPQTLLHGLLDVQPLYLKESTKQCVQFGSQLRTIKLSQMVKNTPCFMAPKGLWSQQPYLQPDETVLFLTSCSWSNLISEMYSWRKWKEINLGKFLLAFSTEYCVFLFRI